MTSKLIEMKCLLADIDKAVVTAVQLKLWTTNYILGMARVDLKDQLTAARRAARLFVDSGRNADQQAKAPTKVPRRALAKERVTASR
jgi:hypothetical protein